MRAPGVFGLLLFGSGAWAQPFVISTIAGGAPPPTPVAAVKASVGDPARVAVDAAGSVSLSPLHSIVKIDSSVAINRFAGNGRAGNSGDGGPAAPPQLIFPMGMAFD